MRRKEPQIAQMSQPLAGQAAAGNVRIGRISALDDEGVVSVSINGEKGQVPARLAIATSTEQIRQAIELSQPVLLLLEQGDLKRPIIIGFVEGKVAPQRKPQVVEADVDGKRVRVVGQDEVVLECGSASITLRRNGRVVIKGTYIETHSDGTNRIKGGAVRIN